MKHVGIILLGQPCDIAPGHLPLTRARENGIGQTFRLS